MQNRRSIENNYKYVWDENSNFIFYQDKSNESIIMGLIEHGEKIKKDEIKKLYQIDLLRYDTNKKESSKAIYRHTIYTQNFVKISNSLVTKQLISNLSKINYKTYPTYLDITMRNEEFNIGIPLYNTDYYINLFETKESSYYFSIKKTDNYYTSLMIDYILKNIVYWLRYLGIKKGDESIVNYVKKQFQKSNIYNFKVLDRNIDEDDLKYIITKLENGESSKTHIVPKKTIELNDECIKILDNIKRSLRR